MSCLSTFGRLRAQVAAYLRPEDVGRIEAAYHFAADAHRGRCARAANLTFPIRLPSPRFSLAGIWMPRFSCAALLHDVMEDTHITKAEISERFGRTTAELVDGVSKLDKIEFQSQEEAQAENFRKMLLAMASDLRVILIKLADRLHNMRTLDHMRPDKRRRIAGNPGDPCPHCQPAGSQQPLPRTPGAGLPAPLSDALRVLSKAILAAGATAGVVGRFFWPSRSVFQWGYPRRGAGREHLQYLSKMAEKRLSFSQVLDIWFRHRKGCSDLLSALGALHALYKPVPGKFRDYIAIPKANGYQSLHTTLIGPFGTPVEVQIRTHQMNHIAESGAASHWLYKEDEKTLTELQHKTQLVAVALSFSPRPVIRANLSTSRSTSSRVKFTPLPQGQDFRPCREGATAVDFAYAVHTDVGNRCVAGRINGELITHRAATTVTRSRSSPQPREAPTRVAQLCATGRRGRRSGISSRMPSRKKLRPLASGCSARPCVPHGLTLGQVSMFAWDRFPRVPAAQSSRADDRSGWGRRLPAIVARRLAEIRTWSQVVQTWSSPNLRVPS